MKILYIIPVLFSIQLKCQPHEPIPDNTLTSLSTKIIVTGAAVSALSYVAKSGSDMHEQKYLNGGMIFGGVAVIAGSVMLITDKYIGRSRVSASLTKVTIEF